jgi:hypothetical protein
MVNRQPHIVLKVHGDVDVDFALVPVTGSLVKEIIDRVDSLKGLAGFVHAEFNNGAPVFFETPDSPGDLLTQVTEEGYTIVTGRPDVHWRHFRRADYSRLALQRDGVGWAVCWRACREPVTFRTACLPVTVIAALRNPYLKPRTDPFAALPDGTPLYPAYYPPRPGERYRRSMRLWTGATGEWVGVTLDGQLYRQGQYWGGQGPRPDRWDKFRLGGAP